MIGVICTLMLISGGPIPFVIKADVRGKLLYEYMNHMEVDFSKSKEARIVRTDLSKPIIVRSDKCGKLIKR